jgi:hypothetical protein
MPRFFLHITNRIGFAADEEGIIADGLGGAVDQAMKGIRSIISDEAVQGRIDLNGRIDIADETGAVRQIVPFADAFEILMPAGEAYPED